MKKPSLFFLFVLALFFSSCFEVEETYNLKEDGSYTLDYRMDMSGILKMTNTMIPDSMKQSPTYALKKDTTIQFSSLPDSVASKLTTQEKEMFKQTHLRTEMDLPNGVFNIGLHTKGKSLTALNYFLTNFGTALDKSKTTSLLIPSGESEKGQLGSDAFGGEEPDLPFKNKEYDYVVSANSFERKIRPEVLSAAKEKNESLYAMMKGMNLKVINTIVINLPKPATSVENSKGTLSADKKQFKLVIDMMEAMAHPEMLNFKINY